MRRFKKKILKRVKNMHWIKTVKENIVDISKSYTVCIYCDPYTDHYYVLAKFLLNCEDINGEQERVECILCDFDTKEKAQKYLDSLFLNLSKSESSKQ